MIACKFFNHWRKVCDWANSPKNKSHIEVISVTFVPRGGWCVYYKEHSTKREDIELAIKTMER